MAPKWKNKKEKEEVKSEPAPVEDVARTPADVMRAAVDAIKPPEEPGEDIRDLAQHMLMLKKEQEEFAPRTWPKSPRDGEAKGSSPPAEEPQAKKEGRQKGWNKAPKQQHEQLAEKEVAKTDDAVDAPAPKAARAKGWNKKQPASDTPPENAEGTSELTPKEGQAKGWKNKKGTKDSPEIPAESNDGLGATPKAKAKGFAKKKKDDAQENPAPVASDDAASNSPEVGAKAKAKAKWSKPDKKDDIDPKSRASKVPPLQLSGIHATDETAESTSPTSPTSTICSPGLAADSSKDWRKTILVAPPSQVSFVPAARNLFTSGTDKSSSQSARDQEIGEAENVGTTGLNLRKANTYDYEVLLNTTLETCIAKGKWDSQPWRVEKPGAPMTGDKRVFDQELPGLGKVSGVEVCTGYSCNDDEYFHSYALIESSLFACTPFLGTLHMTKVADNPNQVFIRFRATWDSGELTLDNQDFLKKSIDSFGDETTPPKAEVGHLNELESLDGSAERMSWSARLRAAAQEVDVTSPDGPSGQDLAQGADLGLSDLGILLTSPQVLDFSPIISPAQKRWADLRTMIKLERSNFYDGVIRSDLKEVLESIHEDELCEVRSYTRPPLLVEHVLANVQCLLGLPEDWESIRRNMRPLSGYLQQLVDFTHTSIALRNLQQMRRRAKRYPASFKPHIVETISGACASLSRWVNVMCWRAGEQNWFHEDVELLAELDKEMISELASFSRPPAILVAVLGNVHVLLGLDESWPKVQSHLKSASNFLQRLQYFDQTTLTRDVKEIMQERHMLYPHSFIPDLVQPVNSACAKLCKWVNAVCLRAGLDFTSEITYEHRGKFGHSGLSAYSTGATVRDATPDSRFAHEETSGWIECIHPDSKFIRPADHTKTLEQLFTPKQGLEPPSQLRMGAAKWLLDPSGERNFRYALPASNRFGGRARSTPVVDNGRARSPLSGNLGVGNRQSRSPSARVPTVSPRYQGGASSVSPRSRGQAQPKMKPSQPMMRVRVQPRQRSKETNSQPQPMSRGQPTVQALPWNRSAPQNLTDKRNAALNVKPATNSSGRLRTTSRSRKDNTQRTPVSEMSTATPSSSSSFSPFMGETSEGKHPDSYLLSALGGPAVGPTIAGVLKRPPKNRELVASVLGNVHCLLGLDPDWKSVLESLKGFQQFLEKMKNLDQSSITLSALDVLRQRQQQCPDSFKPDDLVATSNACAVFAKWINAVMTRASSQALSAIDGQRSSQKGLVGVEQIGDSLQGGVCETEQPKEVGETEQVDSHTQERDGKTDVPSARSSNASLDF